MFRCTNGVNVESEPSTVKSARRVALVLQLLAKSDYPLALPEVARSLNIPRSSAHALLKELVSTRLIEVVGTGAPTYRIGLVAFEVGSAFLRQRKLADEAKTIVAALSHELDETAHLAVLDRTDIVYVAKEETSQAMRVASSIGGRLPAHATAVGRVLLSNLSREELGDLYPNATLAKLTPKTTTDRTALFFKVESARDAGFAFDDEESTPGLQCLAAPVFDHRGTCVAALSVSIPSMRMQLWDQSSLLAIVKKHANELSSLLGGTWKMPGAQAINAEGQVVVAEPQAITAVAPQGRA